MADKEPTPPVAEQVQTQPLPASERPTGPTTKPVDGAEPAEPRKRRRWIGWVIALLVLIALVIGGWVIGDNLARDYAITYIRERVIAVLGLEADKKVDVDIGEGSVLAQAIGGGLDVVTVRVDEVSFGELTGDVALNAKNIPLDSSQPVDEFRVQFSVLEENVARIGGFLSGNQLSSIALVEKEIRIASEFSFLGFITVPVGLGLTPSAVEGQLSFEPTSVKLGDANISVEELRNGQFGGLAETFLASRSFCVAQYLPQALVLDDADVRGKTLVLSINADGTALGDPSMSTMGSCPAAN